MNKLETTITKRELMALAKALQEAEEVIEITCNGNMLTSIGKAKLVLLKHYKIIHKKMKGKKK